MSDIKCARRTMELLAKGGTSKTQLKGEINLFLSALGKHTSSREFVDATALVGPILKIKRFTVDDSEYYIFPLSGTEFIVEGRSVTAVLIHVKLDDHIDAIKGYPRPDSLMSGLQAGCNRREILGLLGAPSTVGDGWVSYVVDCGVLHFTFDADDEVHLISALSEEN